MRWSGREGGQVAGRGQLRAAAPCRHKVVGEQLVQGLHSSQSFMFNDDPKRGTSLYDTKCVPAEPMAAGFGDWRKDEWLFWGPIC